MSDEEKKDVQADAPEATEAEAPTETPAPEAETPAEAPAEEAAPEATPAEEPTAEETTEASAEEETPAEKAPATPAGKVYLEKLEGFDELTPGQTIRLHERIKDISPKGEERERIQVFEGIILAMGGSGISRTVTLRKISGGIAVEKIYPINSPVVAKIELVKTARVRRAKLNFLKNVKRRFKRKLKETHNK